MVAPYRDLALIGPGSAEFADFADQDGSRGIYAVEVGPEGPREPPRRVPGAADPHSISISADGRRLAFSKFAARQNIRSIPIPQTGVVSIKAAIPVTEGNQVIEGHSLSPDGQWIVFDMNLGGNSDIYKQPLDGGRPQLVVDLAENAVAPDWSPDGSEIAFYTIGGDVIVVPADGGTPEQLTDFPFSTAPDWSSDGLAIAFNSRGAQGVDPRNTWIVSRDSVGQPWSHPVQLTDPRCGFPDWAPDGASLLCYARGGEWARVSRDGDVLSRYDPSTAGLRRFANLQFSPDGSRIYVLATHEDGSEGMWWIPASGGSATEVVAFDDPSVRVLELFTVSPENLYLTIAEYESDIWVMDLDW